MVVQDRRSASKDTASPYTEVEYLVILHGTVSINKAFVVPPFCKLRFIASSNTTNFIAENVYYSNIFKIPNTDDYNTGNICEDVVLNGPNKNTDTIFPSLCGIIPKQSLDEDERNINKFDFSKLEDAFRKSILPFEYFYDAFRKPKLINLSVILSDIIKITENENIVLNLLNCRNINDLPYFGDCLGEIPTNRNGNTFLINNMYVIKGVPKLGNIQGVKVGDADNESLAMVYELSNDQKKEIIKDIYDSENKINEIALMFRIENNPLIYLYYDNDKMFQLSKDYVFKLTTVPEINYINENYIFKQEIYPLIENIQSYTSLDDLLNQLSSKIDMVLFFHPDPPNNCESYEYISTELRKRVVTSELGLTNIEDELSENVKQLKSINVYTLIKNLPNDFRLKLENNPIWSQLISSISDRHGSSKDTASSYTTDIIKLTDLEPCLLVILNKFINNRDEYNDKLASQIEELDDENFKSALKLLKFGNPSIRRRHSRTRKHKRSKKTIKRGRSLQKSPKR